MASLRPKPPDKRPDWMLEDNFHRLWEAYHMADDAVAEAEDAERRSKNLRMEADKAKNHYHGMLMTLFQHTIEDL